MIELTSKGSFQNTERFLGRISRGEIFAALNQYGQKGVSALASATPKDSGETANSWRYEVTRGRGYWRITWFNSHVVDGYPVAIALQYGHGTGTGGYVAGKNYINPAIQPIFDEIANSVWKAVKSA